MSLTGNLEDLPLIDIIQIVSFSKKTGYLAIAVDDKNAAIVFEDGLVVAAFGWDNPPLDARATSLPDHHRIQLVRARIEIALAQLVRLREGQFSFSLATRLPDAVAGRDIRHERLTPGINPQGLLLDLARGMDEGRRESSAAIEASFSPVQGDAPEPPEAAPAAVAPAASSLAMSMAKAKTKAKTKTKTKTEDPPTPREPVAPAAMPAEIVAKARAKTMAMAKAKAEAGRGWPRAAAEGIADEPEEQPAAHGSPRHLLLVDDEPDVRQILALRFAEGGYNVEAAAGPDEALKMAHRLNKARRAFVLVTDLGMPATGGASFHGGFEVVKRLWKMKLHPPVLLMTETVGRAVRARARQMGVEHIVFKPGLSKLDPEQFEADLKVFADRILLEILPQLTRSSMPRVRPGTPPRPAMAAVEPSEDDELSRQFRKLQSRLAQLRHPSDASEIAQMVMKVAQEFFERGMLLLVKNEELRGLGGFGLAPKGGSLNLLARELVIPLNEPSPFLDAITELKPVGSVPFDNKWCSHLIGKIGRFKSNQFALIPLLTHRAAMALLLGDNPETGSGFRRLEPLEVFMDQAGLALEHVFLQRHMQAQIPQAVASGRTT